MTPAEQLLEVLKKEEAVLIERRFDQLAELQREKETLLDTVPGTGDLELFKRIQGQAQRNERLMSVALAAIRSLKTRFSDMGKASGAVGYGPDGSRMAVAGGNAQRRV